MSARLLAFLEIETREAVLREVFHAEVRSCRAIRRWIVFSGCVLAHEAAQLGLVRTVRSSNEMVDWAVQCHRQACSVRSANRVILRNDADTSSDAASQRRRYQQRRDAAAVRSCRATFRWITFTAAIHRVRLGWSRTVHTVGH